MPSAQRVNWAKFRVSVVSLVAILILLTLFYLLTGGSVFSRRVSAYLYLPDGSGLERDAPVRVDGVDVGMVRSVRLSGSPDARRAVRVLMEIDRVRLAGIPANSEAEISSDSIIGDAFVDVTSRAAPASLQPGGEIRLKPSADFMKAIDIRDLEKQLREFDAMLQDLEAGRGPVGEFVHGRKMYDDLVKRSAEIERALRAAVSATSAVGKALYTDEAYRQLLDTAAGMDATLAALQSGQGGAGRFLRDGAQYDNLRAALRGVRQSVAALHTGPMMRPDDVYAGWNRGLAALIQRVDDIDSTPAFNTSDTYDSLSGTAQQLRDSVREFRTHPEKFLRLKVF
jgi:phospholipid/cholesterol/gamma-HCH transport system substrate-binding protein